jgi:isopenicillin-N epimerase
MTDWNSVRSQYMIPDGTIDLNNGSYGPTPRPVFEALVGYQRRLAEDPSRFGEQFDRLMRVVKPKLAQFVGSDPDCTAIVTNLTYGMNVFARGIRGLAPGDEILTTNQEYGAVNNAWDHAAGDRDLLIRSVNIPSPPESADQIVKLIEAGISPRTRVIYVSHITTTTGLVLPVRRICELARSRRILSVIDGAHAPGMIRVNIGEIDCDFYTGNCHKWLCAPLGNAFIAAHPRSWDRLEPFLVGWGWSKEKPETFQGNFESPGIHNVALHNAIGEAVDFQLAIGKEKIEARGRELSEAGKDLFTSMPGVKLLTPRDPALCGSMAAFSLPAVQDELRMQEALKKRGIIIPAGANSAGGRMRVSTHIYNKMEDLHALAEALRETYRA